MPGRRGITPCLVLLICLAGPRPLAGDEAGDGDSAREQLSTLPYLSGYRPAPPRREVVSHDRDRASPGVNFYVSGHAPWAYLMDMDGKILHQWHRNSTSVWPELNEMEHWRKAYLFENGDILAIYQGGGNGLVKLDRDSNIVWSYRGDWPSGGPHHDLDVAEDGTIYLLTSGRVKDLHYKDLSLAGPIMEDHVTLLDPRGREIRSVSLLDCLLNDPPEGSTDGMRRAGDIFHTNTVEILDGRAAARSPMLRQGRLLISIPHLDLVAVVDLAMKKVTWAMRGPWEAQHQPTVLDNGNILLFDNKGGEGGNSRVVELEPASRRIVWSYQRLEPEPFLSKTCGTAQRLPNGNTLITDTESGRAFEVTPAGEVVWDFYNPHRAGDKGELIASLFELTRREKKPEFLEEKK